MPTKWSCGCGKVCFTKRECEAKRNFLLGLGREKYLRIYQCPEGEYWHLTKDSYRRWGNKVDYKVDNKKKWK